MTENCAHARTHGLGVVKVGTRSDHDDSVDIKSVRASDYRSDIARILKIFDNDGAHYALVISPLRHCDRKYGAWTGF